MALRVDETDLGDRQQLAKGGMAFVYDLESFRIGEQPAWPLVYKRYKKPVRPSADLRAGVTRQDAR